MAVVAHTEEDVRLLARLMRAEAEGEGALGMLMVGNVGVNRARADCLDFKNVRTIRQMVFYQSARQKEIDLARKVLSGGRYHPASNALWFFEPAGSCPAQWYDQPNTGRFKSHCFFSPLRSVCPSVY